MTQHGLTLPIQESSRLKPIKVMLKKSIPAFIVCLLSLVCLLSCGLEAFIFIDYIPDGIYNDTNAVIYLPSGSNDGYGTNGNYFSNFTIFYRIYISGDNPSGLILTSEQRSSINTALNSDFGSFYNLTDKTSTNVTTTNLENTFANRNYYKLNVEGADIDSILGSGSIGKTLTIDFPPNTGERATLTFSGGSSYVLQRANSGISVGDFNTLPPNDRSFLNHPDLINTANATKEINADVATNSKPDLQWTYVSMYIFAVGINPSTVTRIFSQPTFIGIFRLAESS